METLNVDLLLANPCWQVVEKMLSLVSIWLNQVCKGHLEKNEDELAESVVQTNSVDICEYFRDLGVNVFGPDLYGSLEILKWAREQGCHWDEWTCSGAAEGGHLEVLKWTRKQGYPRNEWPETCSNAAEGGHLEVPKWARKHGYPWDKDTCSNVARAGHLELLKSTELNNNKLFCLLLNRHPHPIAPRCTALTFLE